MAEHETADRTRRRPSTPPAPAPAPASGGDDAAAVGLLALQRAAGNQAVASMVQRQDENDEVFAPAPEPTLADAEGGETAAAAPTGDVAADPSNPIVGLARGDGLNVGTFERRPRVKLLQFKLNEKSGAGLNVDGMWGPKTSKALENFMLTRSTVPSEFVDKPTGDALMGSGVEPPGPGPVPPGPGPVPPVPPVPPAPGPAPFNPHVESHLEAVLAEYQLIFSEQKEALHRFESDLAAIEAPSATFLEDLMMSAISAVIKAFIPLMFDIIREGVNELAEEETLTAEQKDSASSKLSDGLVPIVEKAVKDELAEQKGKGGLDDVGAYVEGQLHGATESTAEVQSRFLINTKPAMSSLNPGDIPTADASDPRVVRADKLRKKITTARRDAFQEAYDRALQKWTVYLVRKNQGAPGTTTPGGTIGEPGEEGTDLSDDALKRDTAPGLLRIEVDGKEADQGFEIDGVQLAGTSEKVRDRLNKSDQTLGILFFPTRVTADTDDPNGDVEVSRNELGKDFKNADTDADGEAWLLKRLQFVDKDVPVKRAVTLDNAIASFLDEVLQTRTSKHKIEKG